MNRFVVSLVANVIAMTSPVNAASRARENEDEFDFAVMRTPDWTLTATTVVNWKHASAGKYPTVASVQCRGESRQFSFSVNSSGEVSWLRVRFLGKPAEDGEQDEITLLGDQLWLYLDGIRWEYANLPARSAHFANITYSKPESDTVMPVWRGYQAVRTAQSQPWINFKLFYHHLITAKQIEWSFKSGDWTVVNKRDERNYLPNKWKNTRYKIDNEGLSTAIMWCARSVSSDDAYILPRSMHDRIKFTAAGDK